MPDLIIYSRLDGSYCRWFSATGEGGGVTKLRDGLPHASAKRSPRRCIWVIQGEDLLLEEVKLAAKGRSELQRALPYALEESLALDVETQVFGWQRSGDRIAAIVASRDLLNQGLQHLRTARLRPLHILPDVLLLKSSDQEWTIARDRERALVRTGKYAGFVCEWENLAWSLRQALEQTRLERRPARASINDNELDLEELALVRDSTPTPRLIAAGIKPPILLELPRVAESDSLDQPTRRRWLLAAALTAMASICWVGATMWEISRLKDANQRLQLDIETVFTNTFPGRRLQDARLQMQIELDRLQSTNDDDAKFLTLFANATDAIQDEQDMTLQGVDYRQGSLSLDLRGTEMAQFERIRQRLQQHHDLQVAISDIQAEGDQATARLRIGGQ